MEPWQLTLSILATAILATMAPGLAETPEPELPPELPWQGKSLSLALPPDSDDPWITPAERDGLLRTPGYDATVGWLRRLTAAAPELAMTSLGKSGEGRDLWMVIASAGGAATPAELARAGKPAVLVQAGIHAGEIDGKDAGMMLLRDLTVGGRLRPLLDRVTLLFVPIFNVDGHERTSPYGRINQRGPESMGWRTNAGNLNLNRDYAKADSPEMRAMLAALAAWQPDLYVDVHVTDGIDYQYDVTWGYGGEQAHSPSISRWLSTVLDPPVKKALTEMGHVPGYLVFADGDVPDGGLFKWSAAPPRFSDGYGGLRHLPTVLVENHSLKPYPQRVLGTYVFLEAVLAAVGEHHESLARAIAEDRARRPRRVTLAWEVPDDRPPEQIEFLGVSWRRRPSAVTGTEVVEWLGEPVTTTVAQVEQTRPSVEVERPAAYWVPGAWSDVIDRLALHGVEMERLAEAREVEVDMYRLAGAGLGDQPYEGRVRATLDEPPPVERRRWLYPPGSVRIPTDQPLGDLAVVLLEPLSGDSFFQWGFFHGVASRTEYVEGYVMEPLAARMLEADPKLAADFAARLEADPDFAADPRARLSWLYRRTPYLDERWQLYPVGREPAAAPP